MTETGNSSNSNPSDISMTTNSSSADQENHSIDNFVECTPARFFEIVCQKCNNPINLDSVNYSSENQNLDSFLNNSYKGRLVLSYHKMNNCLSENISNYVSELVIQREILTILKTKNVTTDTPLARLQFPTSLLKNLAQELSKRFGGRPAVYYSPGVSEGNNKINPTGKLQNQVCYVRKQLHESGLLVTTSSKPNQSSTETRTTKTSEANLKVLSNKDFTDWDAINSAWKESYSCREQLRADKQNKLIEFTLFPCLTSSLAVNLINDDFTTKFENFTPLRDSWPKVRSAVEDFILSKRIDHINYTGSIEELLQSPDANKDAVILQLLLDAIKSTTSSTTKRRKVDEATVVDDKKKDIRESFIVLIESENKLDSEIERRINSITSSKESIYPFMIFVGSFVSPTEFYVIVNKVRYSCASATDALDLTFKIYATTTCSFSKASWNAWIVIKKVVYRIKSQEKSSVTLQKAITYFEKKLDIKID